ncbi:MAG: hypothetical protein AB1894_15490 [Chloroflexota bacterium]
MNFLEALFGPVGPDDFTSPDGSLLREEHLLISRFLDEVLASTHGWESPDYRVLASWQAILQVPPTGQMRLLLALAQRSVAITCHPQRTWPAGSTIPSIAGGA